MIEKAYSMHGNVNQHDSDQTLLRYCVRITVQGCKCEYKGRETMRTECENSTV